MIEPHYIYRIGEHDYVRYIDYRGLQAQLEQAELERDNAKQERKAALMQCELWSVRYGELAAVNRLLREAARAVLEPWTDAEKHNAALVRLRKALEGNHAE